MTFKKIALSAALTCDLGLASGAFAKSDEEATHPIKSFTVLVARWLAGCALMIVLGEGVAQVSGQYTPPTKQEGESCHNGSECKGALGCLSGICTNIFKPIGASCRITTECAGLTVCKGGKCSAVGQQAEGESCRVDSECAGQALCTKGQCFDKSSNPVAAPSGFTLIRYVVSYPVGATIIDTKTKKPIGKTPLKLEMALSGEASVDLVRGNIEEGRYVAVWSSGAKSTIEKYVSPFAMNEQLFVFERPDGFPSESKDKAAAEKHIKNPKTAEMLSMILEKHENFKRRVAAYQAQQAEEKARRAYAIAEEEERLRRAQANAELAEAKRSLAEERERLKRRREQEESDAAVRAWQNVFNEINKGYEADRERERQRQRDAAAESQRRSTSTRCQNWGYGYITCDTN